MNLSLRRLFVSLGIALMLAIPAAAQVTTGNIAGTVTAQGDALPGVSLEAVHTPTGTQYTTVSGANGRYFIPNARVGGPYKITAQLEGFRKSEVAGVQVGVGTTSEVPVTMQLATVSEAITVTADVDPIINPNRTGSQSTVSTEQIETLPTVNRTLQDFARTNPYFNVEAWEATGTRMYVAGRNERYNNIQIDGAVNNDLFGLSDTGTPGGRTDAQPISLDAIEQIQLVVSPYDVRQGMFTGGGVNAVTRSGGNDIDGSVYYSKRSPDFVGKGPNDRAVSEFDESKLSLRLGGPIMRDRLFFFANGERSRRSEPTGVSADGSTQTQFRKPQDAARLREVLISKYGYDPGTLGDISGRTNGNYYFGRLDWNVNNTNRVTLRHNYVDAIKDKLENRSSTSWRFPTATYIEPSKTNSTVLQINSTLGSSMFNEGRIGYQTIRDQRDIPIEFPTIEVGGTGERRGDLLAGTERFSGANKLSQDILEITDDFTWIRGNHNIVIGTHNELFKFANLFLSEAFGYYYFPTLADFEAGKASSFRVSVLKGDVPEFSVHQYGLYVNDQWRVNNTLTLSLGLRGDRPTFVDTPSHNPLIQAELGRDTSTTPSESVVWSPRLGFNWNPGGTNQQVRGGVGIFTGRTPYVWISNIFANTGVQTVSLGCIKPSCTPPDFNPDPHGQPTNLGSGATPTVDLVDPDFQFPRILRATVGYDRDLFFGIRGTVEGLWSKVMQDVFYFNMNKKQTGKSALDGRPTYAPVSTKINDAPMLSNTSKGYERMATLQLNRPFGRNFTTSASYVWMDTESAFDTTSSRAISSFQFNPTPGDIFREHMARSYWEVKHRFNIAATYNVATGPVNHSIGLYYNAQTGNPYTLLMGNDPNRDGSFSNDLLYVPASADAFILCPSNAGSPAAGRPCGGSASSPTPAIDSQRLFDFLDSAGISARGRILDRGELTEPWVRQMDLHYELGLPTFASVRPQILADVVNILALMNKDWGNQRSVVFQTWTPVRYQGQDAASGKPIYREEASGRLTPGNQFDTAFLRSRWQARLSLRVSF